MNKSSDLKEIKASLQSLAKDLECDQLEIDAETLYSGGSKSGGGGGGGASDFLFHRSNRLVVSPLPDSQMTTPEFKLSLSSSTVSSIKGGNKTIFNNEQNFSKNQKPP
jgi:hypothetical protein